jgi:hypothetical protein
VRLVEHNAEGMEQSTEKKVGNLMGVEAEERSCRLIVIGYSGKY